MPLRTRAASCRTLLATPNGRKSAKRTPFFALDSSRQRSPLRFISTPTDTTKAVEDYRQGFSNVSIIAPSFCSIHECETDNFRKESSNSAASPNAADRPVQSQNVGTFLTGRNEKELSDMILYNPFVAQKSVEFAVIRPKHPIRVEKETQTETQVVGVDLSGKNEIKGTGTKRRLETVETAEKSTQVIAILKKPRLKTAPAAVTAAVLTCSGAGKQKENCSKNFRGDFLNRKLPIYLADKFRTVDHLYQNFMKRSTTGTLK